MLLMSSFQSLLQFSWQMLLELDPQEQDSLLQKASWD